MQDQDFSDLAGLDVSEFLQPWSPSVDTGLDPSYYNSMSTTACPCIISTATSSTPVAPTSPGHPGSPPSFPATTARSLPRAGRGLRVADEPTLVRPLPRRPSADAAAAVTGRQLNRLRLLLPRRRHLAVARNPAAADEGRGRGGAAAELAARSKAGRRIVTRLLCGKFAVNIIIIIIIIYQVVQEVKSTNSIKSNQTNKQIECTHSGQKESARIYHSG